MYEEFFSFCLEVGPEKQFYTMKYGTRGQHPLKINVHYAIAYISGPNKCAHMIIFINCLFGHHPLYSLEVSIMSTKQ